MIPQITTRPGSVDVHIDGERFGSYTSEGAAPGFTVLHAAGLRPVTQTDPAAGVALWVEHGNVTGLAVGLPVTAEGPAGRILSRALIVRRGAQSVGFLHECSWVAPDGESLLSDTRTVRIVRGPSAGIILDITLALEAPAGKSVEFGRTDEALLCLRVAPALCPAGGGQMRSSEDQFGPEAIHGRQAAWCACNGVVAAETVGLAFLDHPENPWHPAPWVCREDGLISPSPFPWRAFELEPGRTLTLKYRILVHSGYVEAGWVHARLRDWVQTSSRGERG